MEFIPTMTPANARQNPVSDTKPARIPTHMSNNDDGKPCMISQAAEFSVGGYVSDGVEVPMIRMLHADIPVGLIALLSFDEARMVGAELVRMAEEGDAAAAALLKETLAKREPGA